MKGNCLVVPSGARSGRASCPDRRRRVVLVVQRLEREKRTGDALEIWAKSGLRGKNWTLEVAGRGSEEPILQKQAARLGIEDSVRFLGFIGDVEARMRSAAILLAPSTSEGFGLSVVEAMAVGLPVVAAAAGAHCETLGGVEGSSLVFARGSWAGIVDARRIGCRRGRANRVRGSSPSTISRAIYG